MRIHSFVRSFRKLLCIHCGQFCLNSNLFGTQNKSLCAKHNSLCVKSIHYIHCILSHAYIQLFCHLISCYVNTKIVSEYDQEIPHSQTEDNPMAPRGRAAQPSRDTRKTN